MKASILALAAPLLLLAAPAHADLALAQKNSCTACHAVDKKIIGPAYAEVAKKYGNKPEAVTALAASIKAGGSGKWGPVPMPAQPALSEGDAKTLAAWVLNGAK